LKLKRLRGFWQRERGEKFREIEYEPTSVRELLTEMLDISKLVADLAYSALLLDDKEIAEEVTFLEQRMDTLLYHVRINAMLAAQNIDQAEALSGVLQVAGAVEDISNAASDIAQLVHTSSDLSFLPGLLAKADEKINRLQLMPDSPLANRTVGDLHLETETGNRVVAVRRSQKWYFGIEPNFGFETDDVLLCAGTADGFQHLLRFAKGEEAL